MFCVDFARAGWLGFELGTEGIELPGCCSCICLSFCLTRLRRNEAWQTYLKNSYIEFKGGQRMDTLDHPGSFSFEWQLLLQLLLMHLLRLHLPRSQGLQVARSHLSCAPKLVLHRHHLLPQLLLQLLPKTQIHQQPGAPRASKINPRSCRSCCWFTCGCIICCLGDLPCSPAML